MNPTRKITWVASSLLILSFTVSSLFLRRVDQLRTGSTLREILYINSPKAAKRMSLGYDGLMADIYWTRAVQYFGSHHARGAQEYNLLAPLLNITVALDPHLTVVYEFGSTFLSAKPPQGAGTPEKAVKFVEYGIQQNPNDWHLYYNLGFIYYLELKDSAKAAEAFQRGSQLPDAHPWLKILAARMAEKSGDAETARMMWSASYQTSQDKDVRANAAAHLRALDVDETVPALDSLVKNYQTMNGRLPTNFAEMVSAGIIRQVPIDPMGNPYTITPDGHVVVSSPDELPFIQKGIPPGYVAPAKPKYLSTD